MSLEQAKKQERERTFFAEQRAANERREEENNLRAKAALDTMSLEERSRLAEKEASVAAHEKTKDRMLKSQLGAYKKGGAGGA